MRLHQLSLKQAPFVEASPEYRRLFQFGIEKGITLGFKMKSKADIVLMNPPSFDSADFAVILAHELKHADTCFNGKITKTVPHEMISYTAQRLVRLELELAGYKVSKNCREMSERDIKKVYTDEFIDNISKAVL